MYKLLKCQVENWVMWRLDGHSDASLEVRLSCRIKNCSIIATASISGDKFNIWRCIPGKLNLN